MSLKKLLLAKTDSNASSVTSSDLEMGGVRSVSVYEGHRTRTRVKKWSGHNSSSNNYAYHYRQNYGSNNNSTRKRKKDLIVGQEEDYEVLGGSTQVFVIKGRGKSFEVVDLSETCLLKGSWGEEPEEERVLQFTDSQGRLLLTMEHTVVGPLSASLTLPRHSSTLATLRQVDSNLTPSPSSSVSSSFTISSSILFPHGTVCTFTQATTTNHTPFFLLSSSTSVPLGRLILLSPDETVLLLSPPQDESYSSPLFRLTLIASSLLISKRFPLILPPSPPLLPTLTPTPLPILLTFLLLFLLGLSLVLYTVISIRYKSPSSGDSSPPKFPQSLKSSQVEKGGHHQLSA